MTDRLLDQTPLRLAALAELAALVATAATERQPVDAAAKRSHPIAHSPAPVRLDVLDLIDTRPKGQINPLDPAHGRLGIIPSIGLWVRLICELRRDTNLWMPEPADPPTLAADCAYLASTWEWLRATDNDLAHDLATEINRYTRDCRTALGERPEPRYQCRVCGSEAVLTSDLMVICTECDHEESARNLEAQQRRRPALPVRDLAIEFGIRTNRIHVWAARGKLKRAPGSVLGQPLYFPWDIYRLINPDIAEAIDQRDTTG